MVGGYGSPTAPSGAVATAEIHEPSSIRPRPPDIARWRTSLTTSSTMTRAASQDARSHRIGHERYKSINVDYAYKEHNKGLTQRASRREPARQNYSMKPKPGSEAEAAGLFEEPPVRPCDVYDFTDLELEYVL